MEEMKVKVAGINSKHPFNLYYNGGEYVKICGTQDGYFPDFGHHVANEMGGIWLHPVKLLDGFWLKLTDTKRNISVWSRADGFTSEPWGSRFQYDHGLSYIPIAMERTQFAPEQVKGMTAGYELRHYGEEELHLKVELLARTDLRAVWYSDEVGIRKGAGDHVTVLNPREVLVRDPENDWFVQVGTDLPGDQLEVGSELYGPEFTAGAGCGIAFRTELTIPAGESRRFNLFVAGSYVSAEECADSYRQIAVNHQELLVEKQEVYNAVADRAKLTIEGEADWNDVFAWAKWNNQWLIQKVDGTGRALTAGGPTYPWWFGCDNTYSLQGVLAIGDPQLAKDTLNLLLQKSEEVNGNGRFIHEVTTLGAVSNPGNTQETAHYIAFVWDLFRWTGDEELLRRHYAYCVKGIDWLLEEMDPDHDLFPSGYGIIEIAGLNMELIDSAVYTAKALQSIAEMSAYLQDAAAESKYSELATRCIDAINRSFWQEDEGLYADAVAPASDVAPKVDYLVSLAEGQGVTGYREYVEGLLAKAIHSGTADSDHGWLLNKNWVIVTPMEAGIAEPDKARRALDNMRNDTFIGEYGTYLSGTFQQGTMTISTGVHAVAEAANGNADAALDLLNRMRRSFSRVLPGSFSEMSPDYGCVVQAWTIYALAVPFIRHFFGVEPFAARQELKLRPQLPSAWSGKACSLERLVIADTEFDLSLTEQDGVLTGQIRNDAGWNITVEWNGQTILSTEKLIELNM
ncbi:glycogen debranching protein [Paenibacillus motobuensis]|uniref:alpha-L-rhamnosidase-related protein n=1 Tax=Paenibacillus TaxID=44249 RepID=UPI00203B039B|nr:MULTISPECIES: glycogen debranching protein [Paenibacillus]MCM3042156.1 glycogen debranching protein [Paenibacillus lutimineralis]MCM3649260.1 glycogen debranching protein [Paenibacillus motobuensis]